MGGEGVDYSSLPNWRLIEIAAKELSKKSVDGTFTRREIISYINDVLLKGREPRNPDSLNPMIQAVTVNVPGGAPGGLGKYILFRVGRGRYRLYNPETDEITKFKVEEGVFEDVDIPISRVDPTGRVLIPETVRETLNLKPGDYVAFVISKNKDIILKRAKLKIELE